jgi:hypothetical protein
LRLPILAFLALAVATLRPLWGEDGWPDNHEGNLFALRTHIYARHFSWFDFMPIWSSADVSGFGSPLPLMYHKLFYFLAGALVPITGSLKSADLVAIATFLVLGACGTYLALRELGVSRLPATAGGCCLIAANYTVTNWLVRGALAEFAGAMIVPWVLYSLVKTIQGGRLTAGLGVGLGLLWLSHSVLGYFTSLIVAATLLALAGLRILSWSVFSPRTAWPAGSFFALLVLPYLAPLAIVGRDYDVGRILTPPFQPEYQFRSFLAYLWDTSWRFGDRSSNLTVQLDLAMLALLAAGICGLALVEPDPPASRRRQIAVAALPFLITIGIGLVLQLPASGFFYKWMPGAQFIQFPWRLLAVVTPSLVVAAMYFADKALPLHARSFAIGAAVAWMLASCGAFVPLRYGRFPVVPDLRGVTFSGFREYEPRTAPRLADIQKSMAGRWMEAGCSFTVADPSNEEAPSVDLRAACGRSVELPLPIYASPMHRVRTSTYGRRQPCLPLPDFPGVCGAVIPAGESTISVQMPNMASLAGWSWRRLFAMEQRSPG